MPRTAEVSAGAMHRAHPRLSLADKVEALRQPASYPERSHMVEALETHMSWVFLTDEYVYKLKKPVRYDHQHFGTVSGRRFYCEEELRLNRRLAQCLDLVGQAQARECRVHCARADLSGPRHGTRAPARPRATAG